MWTASLIVTVAALAAAGCGDSGPQRAPVTGQITWEGKPVESGTISFMTSGTAESASASAPITAGKYTIPEESGPAVGANRVEILGNQSMGKKEAGPPFPPGTMIDDTKQVLPPIYNHASKLTADIKDGENTVNFDLKPE